jgi:RNA polymerase sigma-70 factor (ECF subfamily)
VLRGLDVADEDFDLVQRFQSGDVTAFDLLVHKYQSKIYDIVYHYTRDAENAYDLSQEIFEKAFKSLGRFRMRSSFYTWLYKIAVNACIDYGRKRSRFQAVSIEELSSSYNISVLGTEPSPAEAVELQELENQIAKAIQQLPPKQRAVFIMKRQEGLSLEEIAQIMGRSVGTIKAHLSHATHKLMDLLGPYLER